MKKLLVVILLLALVVGCCGCKDSTERKIEKLEKESAAAWDKARDAQNKVNVLESILGK